VICDVIVIYIIVTYACKVLLDTQRKAVLEHNANPINLWVGMLNFLFVTASSSLFFVFSAESFVGKGQYFKKIRYHGRGRHGIMESYHAHYFLTLREGKPPKKKKSIEDTWKYKTRKFIQAGPKSIPNSL